LQTKVLDQRSILTADDFFTYKVICDIVQKIESSIPIPWVDSKTRELNPPHN